MPKASGQILQQAAEDLNIDIANSWMIGDSDRDMGAAAMLGIPAVLVRANQEVFNSPGKDEPTCMAESVLAAVKHILEKALSDHG